MKRLVTAVMASTWIWQQPDWPQFRWDSSALEPLLEQARTARQGLLPYSSSKEITSRTRRALVADNQQTTEPF